MQNADGLPILGRASRNGGANMAAIDRRYAAELHTADGDVHLITFDFERPEVRQGPDGTIDLGQVASFDPEKQTVASLTRALVAGVYGNPQQNPPMITVDDGTVVVWRHVVSFRYLGPADAFGGAVPMAGEAA